MRLAPLAPLRRLAGDPTTLVSLALAGAGLLHAWELGRHSAGLDFYQFWVVAQVAGREDVPDVYAAEARDRIGAEFVRRAHTDEDSARRRHTAPIWRLLEPTGTPMLYTALRPFSGGTFEGDYAAFRVASLGALAAGLLGLAGLLGHRAATGLVLLGLVSYVYEPLRSNIRVGNVNTLQLGLIAAYVWLSSRSDGARLQIGAGALLALTILFKPNLLPALPLLAATWLARRRRRKLALQAAGMGAGVVLAALLTASVFGTLRAWPDWLDYLSGMPPVKLPLEAGNVGLARLLLEGLDLDVAPLLGSVALGAALAGLWHGRRQPSGGPAVEDARAAAAGCLVYLLASPLVWIHYLLLALPAVVVLLRGDGETMGARWRRALAALALFALALAPLTRWLGGHDVEHQAVLSAIVLVTLFAALCADMGGPLRAAGPGTTIAAEVAPMDADRGDLG